MNDMNSDQSAAQPKLVHLLEQMMALHEAGADCVDCETCGEQIDCLAELVAGGYDAKTLLPAVQAHLECCRDCREEFEALLAILRAEQSGLC
jgi:hypothetical protein